MKRYLLVTGLFLTGTQFLNAQTNNSFPATGNVSIGAANYLVQGNRMYYQYLNSANNNFTRGTVANNLYWDNTSNKWYTSSSNSSDFSIIRFEIGGDIGFYNRSSTSAPDSFLNVDLDNHKKLVIKSSGRIGFGTSTPNELFDFNNRTFRVVNRTLLTDFSSTSQYFINFGNYATGASANTGALYGIKLSVNDSFPSATAVSKSSVVFGLVSEDALTGNTKSAGAVIYTSDASLAAVERMRVSSKGNVGIGTASPVSKLDITGTTSLGNKYDPSLAAFRINSGGTMIMDGNEIYSAGPLKIGWAQGSTMDLGFVDTVSYTSAFHIDGTGNVSIGTTNAKGYKLAVNGSAIFTKAIVKPFTAWPDYVFEPGYNLQPLASVENFIKQNKHLPDVPSAAEINENGINIGEQQTVLLKKTEELTLYIIEQDKTIKSQQEQLSLLEERIQKLERLIQSSDK